MRTIADDLTDQSETPDAPVNPEFARRILAAAQRGYLLLPCIRHEVSPSIAEITAFTAEVIPIRGERRSYTVGLEFALLRIDHRTGAYTTRLTPSLLYQHNPETAFVRYHVKPNQDYRLLLLKLPHARRPAGTVTIGGTKASTGEFTERTFVITFDQSDVEIHYETAEGLTIRIFLISDRTTRV